MTWAIIAVIEILLRESGDNKYAQGGLRLAHAHLDGLCAIQGGGKSGLVIQMIVGRARLYPAWARKLSAATFSNDLVLELRLVPAGVAK
jgi:hypothetical protein